MPVSPAFQEKFYEAPGGRMRYLHHANPGRPALLGLHGFKDVAETFLALEPLLSDNFEVFLPDWGGHGGSYRVEAGCYNTSDLFADLIALSGDLLPERYVLLGHSLGAAMSARFAGVFPDCIQALILLEGFAGLVEPKREGDRLTAWAGHFRRVWRDTLAGRPPAARNLGSLEKALNFLRRIHGRVPPDRLQQMAETLTLTNEEGVFWNHDEALNWRFVPMSFPPLISRALWSRVTAPMLLVYGEETNLRPSEDAVGYTGVARGTLFPPAEARVFRGPARPTEAMREIIDHFRDVEYHEIPGAGHNFHREQPEAVREIVAGFLRRLGVFG